MPEKSFLYKTHVNSEWVDYNGHMNDAAYAKVFSLAVDKLIDFVGLDAIAREQYSYTMFTLETHLCYLKEAHEGEKLIVSVQLLDRDSKRFHLMFTMKNEAGDVVATSEQMLMGMDAAQGRPAPFPEAVAESIEELWDEHKKLEAPKQAGRKVGIKR
ncbi:thioesterase family protein [Bhargavaea cecembensis]|uniref:thioesterase family protein n=1 Tax=Bhargavaea cecembensis TaxID=394098 RepID=UPI00058F0B3A|nr:thioesterase family protein [Bhargavaea cecembensis]